MEFNSNAEYLKAFPPKLDPPRLDADCTLPHKGRQVHRIQIYSQYTHSVMLSVVLGDQSYCANNFENCTQRQNFGLLHLYPFP